MSPVVTIAHATGIQHLKCCSEGGTSLHAYHNRQYETRSSPLRYLIPSSHGTPFLLPPPVTRVCPSCVFVRRVSPVASLESEQLTLSRYMCLSCPVSVTDILKWSFRPKPPRAGCTHRGVYIRPLLRAKLLRGEARLDIHRFEGRKQIPTDE